MKKYLYLFISICMSHLAFGINLGQPKETPKTIATPTAPDFKHAIPGTPTYRTIGTKGIAIQCLHPFNRTCLYFVKHGIEITSESPCINQFGTSIPISGELIEPNTLHIGLYSDTGAIVYKEITNTNRQFICTQGYFEIVFPDGY